MSDEGSRIPRTGVFDRALYDRYLHHYRKCYVQPVCVAFVPYLDDGFISEAERRELYASAFGRFQSHRKRNHTENTGYSTISDGRPLYRMVE